MDTIFHLLSNIGHTDLNLKHEQRVKPKMFYIQNTIKKTEIKKYHIWNAMHLRVKSN